MRAHRYRQVIERCKGRKIAFEAIEGGVDNGQLVVTVDARSAMTRHMLDDGRDATGKKPFGDRSTHRGHALRPSGESPAADGRVRPGLRDIKHGRAIDGDPDFRQVESDQTRHETRRRLCLGWLKARFDLSRRRIRAPVWRRHALNPAALLIDQDGRVGASDTFPERARQRAKLIAIADIALEQDQAPGILAAQKLTFLGVEHEARTAANEGLRHPDSLPRPRSPGLLGYEALPALAFQTSAERRGIGLGEADYAQAIDRFPVHHRLVHADR